MLPCRQAIECRPPCPHSRNSANLLILLCEGSDAVPTVIDACPAKHTDTARRHLLGIITCSGVSVYVVDILGDDYTPNACLLYRRPRLTQSSRGAYLQVCLSLQLSGAACPQRHHFLSSITLPSSFSPAVYLAPILLALQHHRGRPRGHRPVCGSNDSASHPDAAMSTPSSRSAI